MEIEFEFMTNSGTIYTVADQHVWRDGTWLGLLLSEKSTVRFGQPAQLTCAVPHKGELGTEVWTTTEVVRISMVPSDFGRLPQIPAAA